MKTENKKIIDWATFCAATGTDEKLPFDVSMLPEEEQKYHEAAHRLPLVIKHFRADLPCKNIV
jgi:hypothetical protein